MSSSLYPGSPPRVWGIRSSSNQGGRWGRFTPTRVGNTLNTEYDRGTWAVHPHACGEYSYDHTLTHPTMRFTPTRVGNTLRPKIPTEGEIGSPPRVWGILTHRISTAASAKVHPHACGEYVPAGQIWVVQSGSPPRVWGIPFTSFIAQIGRAHV